MCLIFFLLRQQSWSITQTNWQLIFSRTTTITTEYYYTDLNELAHWCLTLSLRFPWAFYTNLMWVVLHRFRLPNMPKKKKRKKKSKTNLCFYRNRELNPTCVRTSFKNSMKNKNQINKRKQTKKVIYSSRIKQKPANSIQHHLCPLMMHF